MAGAYYNEIEPFACEWLQNLMVAGVIAPGEVDSRSIVDVRPEDLIGFDQCHFFAGIGVWSYSLRLAGWEDEAPVWTGSCPCQPFSNAGKQRGEADARHLWPEFARLIAVRRPPIVFGEQVASKAGRDWLSRVRADLEAMAYGVGAADLCAAGIGAPHIRQRLSWVAYADLIRLDRDRAHTGIIRPGDGRPCSGGQERRSTEEPSGLTNGSNYNFGMEHPEYGREQRGTEPGERGLECRRTESSGLGNADEPGSQGRREHAGERGNQWSPWKASVFISCSDGKSRRVPANEAGEPEPSLFPLAYGATQRVGRLRAYGNAIVAQQQAAFIQEACKAIADCCP